MDLHDQRNALDPPNRRDVKDKVEADLLVERDVDRVLRVQQQQRVAVRWRVGHGFGCDVTGGARQNVNGSPEQTAQLWLPIRCAAVALPRAASKTLENCLIP